MIRDLAKHEFELAIPFEALVKVSTRASIGSGPIGVSPMDKTRIQSLSGKNLYERFHPKRNFLTKRLPSWAIKSDFEFSKDLGKKFSKRKCKAKDDKFELTDPAHKAIFLEGIKALSSFYKADYEAYTSQTSTVQVLTSRVLADRGASLPNFEAWALELSNIDMPYFIDTSISIPRIYINYINSQDFQDVKAMIVIRGRIRDEDATWAMLKNPSAFTNDRVKLWLPEEERYKIGFAIGN